MNRLETSTSQTFDTMVLKAGHKTVWVLWVWTLPEKLSANRKLYLVAML